MDRKKLFKTTLNIVIYIFAAIGLFFVAGYFAVKFGLTNEKGIIDTQREAFLGQSAAVITAPPAPNVPWQQSEEWGVISVALTKDQAVLIHAAADSGVPARLIAANLIAEQLRLFFTERETYKQFLYPLKILGSQTQFSWGVMGMKEATAVQVEANLKDPASPFYPGDQYAHLLDFPATTTDISGARFARMTDQHNHYWSYLYAGLYIREIEAQWRSAGFPIESNIAVLSTLYNIGFQHSNPNPNPQVGGAAITAGNQTFSFGGLAADFYDSNLLTDIFPR
ncbi:MAG: hypothetical protein JWL88_300 [Parcubacteria group bacterium]|nr:hypothetical protein [Parcubacteria group bacterium]